MRNTRFRAAFRSRDWVAHSPPPQRGGAARFEALALIPFRRRHRVRDQVPHIMVSFLGFGLIPFGDGAEAWRALLARCRWTVSRRGFGSRDSELRKIVRKRFRPGLLIATVSGRERV